MKRCKISAQKPEKELIRTFYLRHEIFDMQYVYFFTA